MTVRLALFDFDGTLADSSRAIVDIFVIAFAAAGIDCPLEDDIRATIGLPLKRSVAVLCPQLNGAQVDGVVDHYLEEYDRRHLPGSKTIAPLFEGAERAISELGDDMVLGIVTGKSRRGLMQSLDQLGLHNRFMVTKTADDGPAKPDPTIALAAMAEMGAEPENTVVIGDTVYDIQMAKSANVSAIGVSWGMHPTAELQRAGADSLITSFEQLPAIAWQLTQNTP